MAQGEGMNYRMWYDEEQGVLYAKTFAMLTGPDVHQLMPEMNKIFADKPHRYVIGDLSDNPTGLLGKEARQAFKEYAKDFKIDKGAVIGTNPSTRMIAKVAISVMGLSSKVKLFKTKEEALAWFREER
jgi:hypothetical protein